jgi:hypothetical protein
VFKQTSSDIYSLYPDTKLPDKTCNVLLNEITSSLCLKTLLPYQDSHLITFQLNIIIKLPPLFRIPEILRLNIGLEAAYPHRISMVFCGFSRQIPKQYFQLFKNYKLLWVLQTYFELKRLLKQCNILLADTENGT